MKNYIEMLLKAEKESTTSLMWSHTGNGQGLYISNVGYIPQEHTDLEKALLKLGCKYDFEKPLEDFCRENGRTTTFFKVPKKRGAE